MASIQLSRYEAEEGDLPDVCMRCGAPATARKRLRFTSHPLWVYLLLPFGWLPYVIVAAVLTENVRCWTFFCPQHRNHWLVRTLLIWGGLVALLAVLFGSGVIVVSLSDHFSPATRDSLMGWLCLGSVGLIFCWLISIPLIQLTAIHPTHVTDRRLTLQRVSPAFVEAVQAYREERRAERREEDERREFRPRRTPPDRGIMEP
jgi:hypothetical protein